MPDLADPRKQSGFVVAILALLGVFTLPQVFRPQDGDTVASAPESAASAAEDHGSEDEEAQDGDERDLKPLLDYLSNGQARQTKPESLKARLARALDGANMRCMLITLPDPIESVASARFDEYLDVIQRAIELQEYVLDRSQLPWKKAAKESSSAADQVTKVRGNKGNVDLTVEKMTPPKRHDSRIGLMVFRRAFPGTGTAPQKPSLVLAFLVAESPILGIHKRAFVEGLDLIDRYFRPKVVEPRNGPAVPVDRAQRLPVLHIMAPCFDSSQRSLEVAINDWEPPDHQKYHFRIVSSGTVQIDKPRLERLFPGRAGHRLTFHSMVHEVTAIKDAMIRYLTRSQHYDEKSIAVLIESNTGLAQAIVRHAQQNRKPDEGSPVEFLFPLQVSEVRKAYEKAGLLRGGKADDQGAPERLRIPPDESGSPRDIPKSYTPAASAAFDEMALTQVLTTISRRPYHAVGIIATNPFDVVFLAAKFGVSART